MAQNASLLLTKAISTRNSVFNSEENKKRFDAVARCGPSKEYKTAYDRWRTQVGAMPGATLAATFTVEGRMIVGIGAENILESSVAMNRLWGVPIIPGSSLKGLASHYTAAGPAKADGFTPDHLLDLFGDTEWAGCVTWLDAWFVPDSHNHPFALDVVTVHHQSYYGDPTKPPTDFEDPIPSNFVSVRGSFLIAVQAPDRRWAEVAMEILRYALEQWGVGAKTNAGYGRMRLDSWVSPWKAKEAQAAEAAAAEQARQEAEAAEAERKRIEEIQQADAAEEAYWSDLDDFKTEIASVKGPNRKGKVDAWAEKWSRIRDTDTQREFARLISPKWQRDDVQPAIAANPTAQEIMNMGAAGATS